MAKAKKPAKKKAASPAKAVKAAVEENLRDRRGKKPLTTEERIQIMEEIYDGLEFWWRESVIEGSTKATGAISYQLERARMELAALKENSDGGRAVNITINGVDLDKLDFGK